MKVLGLDLACFPAPACNGGVPWGDIGSCGGRLQHWSLFRHMLPVRSTTCSTYRPDYFSAYQVESHEV